MPRLRKSIKNSTIVGPAARYFSGNFIQSKIGKKNSTFFNFRDNITNDPVFEITKLDKSKTLFSDRLYEMERYFKIGMLGLIIHYVRNGTPNTNHYRRRLNYLFENTGVTESKLKQSYTKSSFMYVNRLMLRYHNYDIGRNAMLISEYFNIPGEKLRVCDYGCGVADPSLFLALHGADVTIVDLDDSKFDFCKRRFSKRNLPVKAFGARQTEKPIQEIEGEKYQFIFMAEFLEHVRNPRLFLEFAIDRLDNKIGVLYDSLGPVYNHSVGGDHLPEAKWIVENSDYKDYFESNLIPVNMYLGVNCFEHFYIKRGSEFPR